MGRFLLVSAALHALIGLSAAVMGWVGLTGSSPMATAYQVELVSAAELGPVRSRPEPRPAEPVEEDTPPEPEAVEKIPDPDQPERDRSSSAVQQPTPRTGPDAGRRVGEGLPLTLEGRPFPFPWYLEELVRKVQRTWKPTSSTLSATIHFRIDKNGRIHDIEVAETSENFLFDQSAIRAVDAADPLPPLPSGYTGEWLGVYLDFDMQARIAQ